MDSVTALPQPETDYPASGSAERVRESLPTFTRTYRQHFDFVWRSMRALGVERSQLDDAVQDVFVVVYRRGDDFEGRSSVKSWLFGIAYRVAANYRRSSRRRGSPEELPREIPSPDASPHDAAETGEAARFLRSFVDSLPEQKRVVFVACVLEQMTAPEVAQFVDCKVGTIYTRLRAVRAEFRSALGERARRGVEP